MKINDEQLSYLQTWYDRVVQDIKGCHISSVRSKNESVNFINWIHCSLNEANKMDVGIKYVKSEVSTTKFIYLKDIELKQAFDERGKMIFYVSYYTGPYGVEPNLFGILKSHENTFPLNIFQPKTTITLKEEEWLVWDKIIDGCIFSYIKRLFTTVMNNEFDTE